MKKRTKMNGYKRKERLIGLLFVSPVVLKVLIFNVSFMIYSLFMSVTDWNILAGTKNFIGFTNFVLVLKDPLFWKSVANTFILMLDIPIGIFLGMLIAIALNRKIPGKNFFRVSMYLPALTSTVAVAILWRYIYNADYGFINLLIQQLTGHSGPNWLGDPNMVKTSMNIMGVWRGLGNLMLLFLSGLQNISPQYYEVIDVEGGNGFHKFRYVTMPMLTPVIFYNIVNGIIGGLQAFSDQFIMTGVGPENSAISMVYYLWQKGFAEYDMGAACATGWILCAIILVITLVQFKVSDKWVYEE